MASKMNVDEASGQQLSRSYIVEMNGVQFQTEIQSVIPIPFLPWTKTPLRLGIRVTNDTSNRLYFERLDSLNPLPILIDSRGNAIEIDGDMLRLQVNGKPYYSVATGESEFFSFESFLSRGFFRPPVAWSIFKLQMKIYNEAGGFYYFYDLKPGKYQLQISYRGSGSMSVLSPEDQASGRFWTGAVTLPFVELRLGR